MLVPSTTLFRSHPARSRVALDTGIDKARRLALPCAQQVVASRCAAVSDAQKAEMIGPTAEAVPGTMFRDPGADDETGRAHVCNPVTHANLVCRLMLEKNNKQSPTYAKVAH